MLRDTQSLLNGKCHLARTQDYKKKFHFQNLLSHHHESQQQQQQHPQSVRWKCYNRSSSFQRSRTIFDAMAQSPRIKFFCFHHEDTSSDSSTPRFNSKHFKHVGSR